MEQVYLCRMKFNKLKNDWKSDTFYLSSISQKVAHPAYQEIISMGADALPLIIQELKNEPSHWFPALRSITGYDPVSAENRGRIDAMAAEWINWWSEVQS
jgi:hypothetical protein